MTSSALTVAKATKGIPEAMTSLFATSYGIFKKQFSEMSDADWGDMFGCGLVQIGTAIPRIDLNLDTMLFPTFAMVSMANCTPAVIPLVSPDMTLPPKLVKSVAQVMVDALMSAHLVAKVVFTPSQRVLKYVLI